MATCNCNKQPRMPGHTHANMPMSEHQHDAMHKKHHSCDFSNMPVGMSYVPWQYFDDVYDIDKALQCGTIFPELNKPFLGKRGVANQW